MSLAPGQDLAHYRLLERIGAGGMGVVWKATDTTLGRAVAIKVLPEAFAADPERMARFEREARLLAALNHPHIAAIYGVGVVDGVHFLAMELVEGEDLALRLARGPIPVAEMLELACQIAAALEAAHEKGIIHRDLKTTNVKFTADGQLKLLDFGLAKALEGDPSATSASAVLSSPTLTSPMTAASVILGTAAYMSPEQARGKAVDRRTDIWAFGCVLYECLTGQRAFPGETVSDTIAKILEREPDWTAIPAAVPARLLHLLRRCFEKDARQRLRDMGDARIELEEMLALGASARGMAPASGETAIPAPRRGTSARLAWGVAVVALVLAALALLFPQRIRRSPRPIPTRTLVTAPAGVQISTNPADAAISPDGRSLVFVASDSAGNSRLWLRRLDALEARPIEGTDFSTYESPGCPFWSPDGQAIGFFTEDKLKTVPVTGGSAQILTSVSNARGGTWNRQGVILFARFSQGPLFRVSQSVHRPILALSQLAALVFLLHACAGDPTSTTRPEESVAHAFSPLFIVNGLIDDEDAFGNVGAFIVQRPSDGQVFPICSGTLIAPTVFLTTAHRTQFYLDELAPEGYSAFVSFSSPIGSGDLTDLGTVTLIPVSQVVTNPAFSQRQSDPGDIGVLILPPGTTVGITPATLPSVGLLDQLRAQWILRDATFTAVGYGVQDRVVGAGPPFFESANPVPRMYAFSSFDALNPGWLRLSQNPATGDGGTCFGDSGGPNFLTHDGEQILVANTVAGDAVCRATNVVYRLDTPSARSFLGRFVELP